MKEFYKDYPERPSGGRLYQRPNEVKICKICGEPIGRMEMISWVCRP